jgi:predicted O-methyltransferase YrrM
MSFSKLPLHGMEPASGYPGQSNSSREGTVSKLPHVAAPRAQSARMTDRVLLSIAHRLRNAAAKLDVRWLRRQTIQAELPQAPSIPTHMTHRELRSLHDIAARCPNGAVALEVGSYLGASACYLATGLLQVGGTLVCVDTWNNETMPDGVRDTFAEFQENTRSVQAQIRMIRKRSDELTVSEIKASLDVVFLDGDHGYDAVHHECGFFAPLIKDGGILAFHDCICYQGVARSIGELLASGQWQINGVVDNLCWLKKTRPFK